MAVDPKLLEILACPVCKVPVDPTPSGDGLKCRQCRRVYPVKDDIPIMLVDQAVVDPAGSGPA
ncbi:MAG TPA: Trm112 family protein [Candidatus Polarisedimenticolia bacterium]|nr:Trm112 family protein [Candidatus Polarisedimenticolia bacterium]